jgi:hypothetical protein
MKPDQTIYPRDLTDEERVLTRWIIENGSEDSSRFLQQLEQAKVCSKCSCGCASVDFEINGSTPSKESGMEIIGDFVYGDENTMCGVFVFSQDNQLSGLEVYPLAVDEAPKSLPSASILRPITTEIKSTEPAH